jgi:hypothetical protein
MPRQQEDEDEEKGERDVATVVKMNSKERDVHTDVPYP